MCSSKLRCEPAPLLLGFVLGPLLEENLRRAMILSRGDPTDLRHAADQRRARDTAVLVLIVVFMPASARSATKSSSMKRDAAHEADR